MRWDELTEPEKMRLARALRERPTTASLGYQVGIEKQGGEYFCSWMGAMHDFIVSAQKAADVTGHEQTIHCHNYLDPCADAEHVIIEPDPLRSRAVGGPEHLRTS